MKIKMVKRKWNTPRSWRGMKKLAMYCASHYPKDAKLAAAVRGCFTSFDDCATTLVKKSKHATKSRRKMARRAPKRWGVRRNRRSAAKRFGTRRSWRRGGHRRTHRARRAG